MCPSSILFFFLCTRSLNNLVLINVQLMYYYIGWSKNKIQIQSGDSNSLYQNVVACSWTLLWSSSREVLSLILSIYIHSTAFKVCLFDCIFHFRFTWVSCLTPNLGVIIAHNRKMSLQKFPRMQYKPKRIRWVP